MTAARRLLSVALLGLLVAVQTACGGAKVKFIEVTPATASVAAGTVQPFSAVATYTDSTKLDVTSAVTWAASDATIIVFDTEAAKGVARAHNPGSANITATFQGIVGKAKITVTAATQSALTVTPLVSSIAVGTSTQLHASATFSDGTTQDVTNVATWTSSLASSVIVDATGLAQGVAPGAATLTATLGTLTATASVSVTGATLTAVAITPATPSLHLGATQQLTATGTFSDATTQDLTSVASWTSTNSLVAAFIGAKGVVSGLAAGSATVSATVSGVTALANVTVTSPVVTSVAVTPSVSTLALGTSVALTAKATLSDGTVQDVTATATWTTSDGTNAPVDATGLVHAFGLTTATVTATVSAVSGTATVTVTNAVLTALTVAPVDPSLPIGGTVALTATGTLSDGTTQNLTSVAAWTSDAPDIATFPSGVATGTVRGVAAGSATLTATVMGISGSVSATVTGATITAVRVSPAFATLALGTSKQLAVLATLSDGTTSDVSAQAEWSVGTNAAVSVSTTGLVLATAVGQSDVTATVAGFSATSTITVTNANLVSIALTPENVTVAAGSTVDLFAIGTFSDGTTQDLSSSATWTSSDITLLTVSAGVVTGVGQGTAVVTASLFGVTGTLGVTVLPADVVSLAISPALSNLARGTSEQLTATATLSDGSTQDVTASATWVAATPDGISVTSAGLVQTSATGSFVITATFGGVTAAAQIVVTTAELTGLVITPAAPSVAVGLTTGLTVVGTFTDLSTQDLTSSAVWVSSAPTVADFKSGSPAGVVTGLALGTADLSATVLGSSVSVALTVTDAELLTLTAQPTFLTLALGTSGTLALTGTFSDGSTFDETTAADWQVGSAGGVTVAAGVVTATGVGATTVVATFGTLTVVIPVTVTNATLVSIAVGPAGATTPVGEQVQLSAIGTFTDGTTQDVTSSATWTTTSEVLSVTGGLVTGAGVGTGTVTATYLGVSAPIDVSITAAVVTAIDVQPALSTLALGTTGQLSATASLSDGSTPDVTALAQWQVASGSSVSVSTTGALRALSVGTSDILVTYGGVTAHATVAVTGATLTGITVAPNTTSLPVGTSAALVATGSFTDGTTQDLTSAAVWTSSDASVVTVTGGHLVAVAGGTVQITAALSGQVGTASVSVTTEVLTGLALTPASPIAPVGTPLQFTATGTFSDGSTHDVTSSVTWTSADASIAAFSDTTPGLVTTAAPGSVVLTATLDAITATVSLNVTDAALRTLVLSPSTLSLARGTTAPFTATGTFTDGTSRDLTSLATFASSDAAVAAVSNAAGQHGLVSAVAVGSAGITATVGTVTSSVVVIAVSDALLASLEITPANAVSPVGVPVTFTAIGTFTDLSTQDLTSQVSWTLLPTGIATFGAPGSASASIATGIAAGSTTVSATKNGVTGTATLNVSSASLTSIALAPTSASLAQGTTRSFTATGSYSDGTSSDVSTLVTWTSGDAAIASVSNAQGSRGLVTGLALGSTAITATLQGVSSDAAPVAVTAPVISAIALSPAFAAVPNGLSQSYTASATLTDGSHLDVTATATWTLSDSTVGTLTTTGGVVSIKAITGGGTATVTATVGGISGTATFSAVGEVLSAVAITPGNSSLASGRTLTFTATGTFSDGTTRDLSSAATWTTSNAAVATVTLGTVKAVASGGTAQITAAFGDLSDTVTLTTTDPVLASLALTPPSASVAAGLQALFVATATFTDGTTSDVSSAVTWTSSDSAMASVDTGLVTAHYTGSFTLTAATNNSEGALITASAPVVVTAAELTGYALSPTFSSIPVGYTVALSAIGTFSDGSTQDITAGSTFSTLNETVATVSNDPLSHGVVLGEGEGETDIVLFPCGNGACSSLLAGLGTNATIEVTPATLTSLAIAPSSPVVPNGTTVQLTATGTFSDGSSRDVSSEVSWSSSLPAKATVSSTGLVTAASQGTTTITVSEVNSLGNTIAVSSTVTVVAPLLSSLSVAPSTATLAAGTSLHFTATGVFTDGTSQNLTSLVTWSSSSAAANISNSPGSVGLAQGVSAGSATITATSGSITSTAALTVTDASLVSIEISPPAPVLANGTSVQLSATGTYSNGSTQDISFEVGWAVSGSAFTLSPSGLLTAVNAGTGTITVTDGTVTATTIATVTSATLDRIDVSPASATIAKGTSVQLSAVGRYSDGTAQNLTSLVTWAPVDSSIVSVTIAGSATGLVAGQTQVTATLNGVTSAATLTVSTADLVSVAVTPSSSAFAKGTTKAFTATGTYSDNSVQDLTALATWTSSDATIAAVSNATGTQGVVTGAAAGSATITATYTGISGSATANVTSASLASINVSPAAQQIARGTSLQFTATGLYSDGSSQDLTSSVTWTSSDGLVASISNVAASRGLAHGLTVGSVVITATSGTVFAQVGLTVSPASLTSIAVTPAAPVLANGTSTQLTATGTLSDGTTQDLTTQVTWSSSTGATVFSATTPGLLQAASVGTSTLTATFSGVSGVATATVTDATLTALEITPSLPSLASGTSLHLAAKGTYSDGSTQDVTSLVAWSSSAPTVATVSNATGSRGLLSAGAQGTATITATLSGVSISTDVTVSNAVLDAIAIAPSVAVLAKGTTLAFTATGSYSDGSTQDLTTQVTWSTADVSIAAVSTATGTEGVVTGLALGQTDLTAAFSGVTQTVTLTVTTPVLRNINVSSTVTSLAAGTTTALTATGVYSDNSSLDLTSLVVWASEDTAVLTVSNGATSHGVVHGEGAGSTDITATYTGVVGRVTLAVTSAVLSSLQITPVAPVLANGTSRQLTATGTLSDGTTQDLTDQVAWSSDAASLAFSSTTPGLLLAQSVGSATLTASLFGVSTTTTGTVTDAVLTLINVNPTSPTIAKGTTLRLSAIGVYSDGSTSDITSTVTWSSADATLVTVSNASNQQGLVTGVDAGTATITATLGLVSGTTDVSVTGATLDGLIVLPPTPVIAKGTTQGFQAIGTYSDGTQQDLTDSVTWESSDTSVAVLAFSGGFEVATGIAAGTAQITATVDAFSASATLTVTSASLTAVAVSPATATIANGTTQQFVATGTYSDGTTQDLTTAVTWSTSNTAVATISNATGTRGIATGASVGTVSVSATLSGVTGTGSLTISNATLSSITVASSTGSNTISRSSPTPLIATGHYTDGSTQIITTQVTWTSSNTAIATVSNAAGTYGNVTGVAAGTVTITAAVSGKSGTLSVTVSNTNLNSIQVTPPTARLALGTPLSLRATGTYSDNTTSDLTTFVTWTSSNTAVATVSSTGVVTPRAAGTATISAAFGGRTGTSAITVSTATLSSIVVTPSLQTLAGGVAQQYKATAIFSDNTTQDVSALASWSSTDSTIASISSTGLVTTGVAGAATISATYSSRTGSTTLTVSAATLSSVVVTPATLKLARNTKGTLKATATFSDGTTLDVTSAATWTTSNSAVATVSSTGQVSGVAAGAAAVTGTWAGASGTSAVTVTAATLSSIAVAVANGSSTTIQRGFYKQLKATGTFSDGTTQDLTELATWTSSSNSATVSNVAGSKGLVYGVSNSFFLRISAVVGTVSGRLSMRVSTVTLSSIAVTAVTGSSLTVPAGFASHLRATGTFSDNSTADLTSQVTWSTSNSAIAAASSTAGVISALSAGTATARATYTTVTGSATMTVSSATLSSIAVTTTSGGAASVAVGANLTVKATGTFSNGTTLDISGESAWTSANPAKATVVAGFPATVTGVASTTGVGISATASGLAGTLNVVVP